MATQSIQQENSPVQSLRQQRNDMIRADYQRMYTAGKRNGFILAELSKKYYLAPDSIERIVWQRGAYRVKDSE